MRKRANGFRLFLAERHDPIPFHEYLAAEAIAKLEFPLVGATVLDLGCGPGHYSRALRRAGATVVPIDLDAAEFRLPGGPPGGEVVGSGMELPIRTRSVDGVFTSNTVEHTPEPARVIDEAERVIRPGGWLWMSWTNWYSPWGGHDMSPFHYLGPRFGMRVRTALGYPPPKNYPLRSLFPLHIGPMLRDLRSRPRLRVMRVVPRYYPSQKWVPKVPGLREFATWNCLVVAERTEV